ncbi:Pyridoxine 4-dehydrogenase [Imshaugia aleurites]|uniref:Pyridoxine 4-dehydrogenase n=1 Tax=Imshaugia aleurites TaxID=172621 RepID=A0A8H3IKD4_9LECA|nr:Pyridoxine 4-dehydrogenase [Imshaugia aleurites]
MSTIITGKHVGLTWRPNPTPYDEAMIVMKTALQNGADFWNGAEFYGPPTANSLQLLNHYFTQHPEDKDKVVLSIKGAFDMAAGPDCSAEGIKKSIENCLSLLDGKKFINIFKCARVDPKVPVEESIAAIAEYVKAGKIGGIGLSEVNADTIRKAHAVHPISAVEVEFSLFSTDIKDNGVGAVCAELGIPIVARDDIPEGDVPRRMPRFEENIFGENLKLVDEIEKIAKRKGVTPPQVAIAWVSAQSQKPGLPTIVPIPGATKPSRVVENLAQIQLDDADLAEIDEILSRIPIAGARYPAQMARLMDQ